ncbi:MAG: PQQ-like beta-propeller repeat protein [Planctomycetes bacterium]|nr:PQQ-like beta-propeller repeat protein [Planctomycetota bacterium]
MVSFRFRVLLQIVIAAGIAATRLASPVSAADWPQFRGPHRTDVASEKNLLTEWPADGPKLLWSATGYGEGFSSIALVGDRIYSMGDHGDGSVLLAADRANGKVLWRAPVGKPGGNYKGTRCTPTVDGDRVYGLGQFGEFVCCETATGKVLWKKNFPGDFGGQFGAWQYTESPLVDGDKVICTPGGANATMVAFNKRTGDVIWKGIVPGGDTAGYSSIVIAETGGIRQYVQLMANGLVGFSAKDGKLLWRYGDKNDRFGGNTANIPTPIIQGEFIFTAAGYGRGGGLTRLVGSGKSVQAEEVYFSRDLQNKHGGVVLVGDYVYGDRDDSGSPWCAEWKTGKVRWRKEKSRVDGRGSVCVTYADGHLYFQYQNGVVTLVEASADSYKETGAFRIPDAKDPCWAHPVVCGGKLYIRNQDTLLCYDVTKP